VKKAESLSSVRSNISNGTTDRYTFGDECFLLIAMKCSDVVLQQIITTVPTDSEHDHYLSSCFVVSSDL
jgi:hypothetical protein